MRLLAAALMCLVAIPIVAQGQVLGPEGGAPPLPRVSLPSAELVGREAASASYTFRGASYKGRDMAAHQVGLVVGVTERLELAWDFHDINIDGRTAGNSFDVEAMGWQARYGMDLFGESGAVFLQFRDAEGEVVRGGALRIPPDAETISLGATRSSAWGKKADLHLTASISRSELGNQSAMTWMGGAGVDYPLNRDLTAQGGLALFKETGDISSFEAGISGGVHYETKSGFTADVFGTILPAGTPLAGSPLADGSVFILDPVFRTEPIVRQFQNDSIGFYEVRGGYSTTF